MPKTIYLVRHGESEANVTDLMSGSLHDIALTTVGKQQARETGKNLKNKGIELIVSSPMIRAFETAKIIAREIGYNPKKIIANPLFVERSYGIYDGGSSGKYLKDKAADNLHESVETTDALHKRVSRALGWLKNRKANNIVLVSHGTTARMIQVIIQELQHHEIDTMKRLENAEVLGFKL